MIEYKIKIIFYYIFIIILFGRFIVYLIYSNYIKKYFKLEEELIY